MRPDFARLEAGQAETVWQDQEATFVKQVVGPHFDTLCRQFAILPDATRQFDEALGEVCAGVVIDPVARQQIEIDMVIFAVRRLNEQRRILSLGEVRWGETMGHGHVARLAGARDLLTQKGFDTIDTKLTCYSAAGFTNELRTDISTDLTLIGLDRLYSTV